VTVLGAIETASAALELGKALADAGNRDRETRSRVRPIIDALRGIYFTPNGTRKVLGVLADGRMPPREDIQDVLTAFNDAEWRVERFRGRLDFEYLERFDISLRQRRTLEQISWGKVNLRRDIQDALNGPLTQNRSIDAGAARDLLNRVVVLNALIEALEEEFL